MPFEFLKLVVVPVILERDDNGGIVKEQTGNQVAVYSREEAMKIFDEIDAQIESENDKGKKEVEPNGD